MKTKKVIVILGLIFMSFLTGCGWTKEVPKNTAEVLFQKDGYESPYTYVMEYDILHEYPIKLEFWGINFFVTLGEYRVILRPNGTANTILYSKKEEEVIPETDVKNLLSGFVSEEELARLLEGWYDLRYYKDATYLLFWTTSGEDKDCELFVYRGENDIRKVSFVVTDDVIKRQNGLWYDVFEGNSICVSGEIWFDENLEPFSRVPYDEIVGELTQEQIRIGLRETEIEELIALADNRFFNPEQERYALADVCYAWTMGDMYILEYDRDGNLLYAVRVIDPNDETLWYVSVRNYDLETDTYYHIKRQVGK